MFIIPYIIKVYIFVYLLDLILALIEKSFQLIGELIKFFCFKPLGSESQ